MPLAGDQHHVLRGRLEHRSLYRAAPVGLAPRLAAHAARDRSDDAHRILAARVVGGDQHAIGTAGGGGAHQRALRWIAIAAGAENHDEAAAALRGERTQRVEHFLERIGCVRVIDDHERALANRLHPPRHVRQLGDQV